MLDYLSAPLLFAWPRMMGWGPRVTRLFDATAIAVGAVNLFTRHDFGVVRVLPMKAHLAMDAVTGGKLLVAAATLDDEPPAARACLASVGLWEIAAALLTDPRSPQDRQRPAGKAVSEGAREVARAAAKSVAGKARRRSPALQSR